MSIKERRRLVVWAQYPDRHSIPRRHDRQADGIYARTGRRPPTRFGRALADPCSPGASAGRGAAPLRLGLRLRRCCAACDPRGDTGPFYGDHTRDASMERAQQAARGVGKDCDPAYD
jgi:hypothetical protein